MIKWFLVFAFVSTSITLRVSLFTLRVGPKIIEVTREIGVKTIPI